MQTLIPGVKIFFGSKSGILNRLELSAGTTSAHAGCHYEKDATVPLATWRTATARERAILTIKSARMHFGSAISIVSMPAALLRPFASLRAAAEKGWSKGQINSLLAGQNLEEAISAIASHIREHFTTNHDADAAEQITGGLRVNAPAQATTTEHPQSQELVGLHLDDWSQASIEHRHTVPNRITINLGSQDRFFLFINLPIAEMYQRVQGLIRARDGGTAIARVFMATYPSYPVVRVRIHPGEAYIAPTENIVHDGSSATMSAADVSLSLRGRIALLPVS